MVEPSASGHDDDDNDDGEKEKRLTSFKGRVMGLPEGSPTGAWSWAAARLANRAMAAWVNMVAEVVVEERRVGLGY